VEVVKHIFLGEARPITKAGKTVDGHTSSLSRCADDILNGSLVRSLS
jgi:hypothetical protein